MLEQIGRNYYQRCLVNPVVRWIDFKVSPLVVTALSVLFGFLFIPLILISPMLAIVSLLLSGYCDTLDGSLARHQNTTSDLGCVLDIIADRIVEFCAILGFYMLDSAANGLACMLMLGSVLICITSFLVVGIFIEKDSQKSFHYSPGIMERAEAFIFFIAMALIPSWFVGLAYLFIVLVLITAVIRVWQFAKVSR